MLEGEYDDGWDLSSHKPMDWKVGDRLELWDSIYVIDCVYGPYDCHIVKETKGDRNEGTI